MKKPNNFQRIRELNTVQKAALAAALLERMLPNYTLFSEALEFGEPEVLRNALALCWEKILLPKSKISIDKLVEKVEPNVPEVNDFDVFGVYPAIDAATALLTLLQGLQSKDEQEYVSVCKIAQGTVARLIEYQFELDEQPYSSQDVNQHPLMEYEIEVLGELIDFVAAMTRLDKDSAKALRQLAVADGQTNIGVEI
ncbi:YjaG family protein [Pseudoalteromonas sp. BDTF-M6]|uniref:YjaG family protein n=1 Tax=Pseudoalteromonas sp. BDTF-M6 TaxID=2796132 RepID=UPI001BAF86EF|nr:YjaG family protein [Pseudoalteromonas sp. BDTF-M6]MBS3798294.1 YjaG family protein [Pseudoalteromonas sp. BDTF-M6]